ncbi:MAG: Crp/Fnr family transcriptional regulator [Sphingobacterium sp.]|jgi:CRP-like cAMP-binding protein|nr:Crp/Fnr family transcriptional regulator [Sphingobacterium sp.]
MQTRDAYQQVIEFFDTIYPTTAELQSDIRLCSKVVKYPKRAVLADIGQIHKSIYFILKGSIRTYYRDKNQEDITSWLLFEGDLAISIYSFYNQAASFEAMEALEDTWVLVLSYDNLMNLYLKHMEFNYIGRRLTEAYYIKSEDKVNALRMLTAKERYDHFLRRYPTVLQKVPLRYVASYLGITQSTLSRVRGQK